MNFDPGNKPRLEEIGSEFFYIQQPFPTENYTWWTDYVTPAGRRFELELLTSILDVARVASTHVEPARASPVERISFT